jgi:hypothetical protein
MNTNRVEILDADPAAVQPDLPAVLRALADALFRLYYRDRLARMRPKVRADFYGRQLVCTPYEGCYGHAGWVVCVNGSPPRGTLLIDAPTTYAGRMELVYYEIGVRPRLVTSWRDVGPVGIFHDRYLKGRTAAVTFDLPTGEQP